PLAAFDGVHEVALYRIALVQRHVVAALDHAGAAAFAEQALGCDRDVQCRVRRVRMQRCKQPRAAGAEDQYIGSETLESHGRSSEHSHEEYRCHDHRNSDRQGRELLLPSRPRQVLDQQQTQASQEMNRKEEYETAFGKLHDRPVGPAQKALQLRFTVYREAESEEMHGQENGQSQSGESVNECGQPKQVPAMIERTGRARNHGDTTAATAPRPSAPSKRAKPIAETPAARSLSGDHSVKMLRMPIEAWLDAARTKVP